MSEDKEVLRQKYKGKTDVEVLRILRNIQDCPIDIVEISLEETIRRELDWDLDQLSKMRT